MFEYSKACNSVLQMISINDIIVRLFTRIVYNFRL